jgi:hypothetical protein
MATALTQTTLSAAITATQTTFTVASGTNLSNPTLGKFQAIYVIDPGQTKGELMTVLSVASATVTVARLDQFKAAHASGSIVLIANVDPTLSTFYEYDPSGAPPSASQPLTTPWVNAVTGEQWLIGLNNIWVPGWNNRSSIKGVTAAVASAAGLIVPSGPLFHITGTAAITGFTIPTGFAGGSFNVIPDAIFTWTAANNIALAGTAVVSKTIEFTYDANAALFYPSVIG